MDHIILIHKVHPRNIIYDFILSMKCSSLTFYVLHESSVNFFRAGFDSSFIFHHSYVHRTNFAQHYSWLQILIGI